MAAPAEWGGRLLAACLMAFFVAQVIISVNKLRDRKIAASSTTQYADRRLMPSLSVCFPFRETEIQAENLEELVEKTMNETRQVNLYRVAHLLADKLLLTLK